MWSPRTSAWCTHDLATHFDIMQIWTASDLMNNPRLVTKTSAAAFHSMLSLQVLRFSPVSQIHFGLGDIWHEADSVVTSFPPFHLFVLSPVFCWVSQAQHFSNDAQTGSPTELYYHATHFCNVSAISSLILVVFLFYLPPLHSSTFNILILQMRILILCYVLNIKDMWEVLKVVSVES